MKKLIISVITSLFVYGVAAFCLLLSTGVSAAKGVTVAIVNAGFAAPVPDQVTVEGPIVFDPAWPDGVTWTKWGDSGENFTGVGCTRAEDVWWDHSWFLCWGFPTVVPGWEFTGDVLYRDFFDGTFASDGQGNYSDGHQLDLREGTRLWQTIDNPAGAVVFRLEYAWLPYWGWGVGDVYFDGTLLATHGWIDGVTDYVYTGLNYNWWADATDFFGEPEGQGVFNWQLEEQIIVTAEVLTEVSIAFEGSDPRPSGHFGDPGGGVKLDYANVYAPAKVRICHGGGGHNPRTIEVANGQSVLDHLSNINHVDRLGACGDPLEHFWALN